MKKILFFLFVFLCPLFKAHSVVSKCPLTGRLLFVGSAENLMSGKTLQEVASLLDTLNSPLFKAFGNWTNEYENSLLRYNNLAPFLFYVQKQLTKRLKEIPSDRTVVQQSIYDKINQLIEEFGANKVGPHLLRFLSAYGPFLKNIGKLVEDQADRQIVNGLVVNGAVRVSKKKGVQAIRYHVPPSYNKKGKLIVSDSVALMRGIEQYFDKLRINILNGERDYFTDAERIRKQIEENADIPLGNYARSALTKKAKEAAAGELKPLRKDDVRATFYPTAKDDKKILKAENLEDLEEVD